MGTTIAELNQKAERIKKLRDQETEASNAKKIVTQELELAEREFMETLKADGLDNFRSKVGLLSISHRKSVKTPKTDQDKAALYAYLKELGMYDRMISVNSQTLNSFYNDQFEQAKERGETDFEIPGLNEVTITETLSFKKV